jgi:hypothetical protein
MRYVTGAPRAHGCSKLGSGGSFSGPDKRSRKGNGLLTLFSSFYFLRLLHFYRYRGRGRWRSRRHRGATGAQSCHMALAVSKKMSCK